MKKVVLSVVLILVISMQFIPFSLIATAEGETLVRVTGISPIIMYDDANPETPDGNPGFIVTFDKPITNKFMPFLNSSRAFIEAYDGWGIYTTEDLNYLESSGAKSSVLNKILFDGKSIADLMNTDPNESSRNTTIMIHASGSTLEVYFQNNGVNDIDINLEHSIEFTQGFVFPNGSLDNERESYVFVPSRGVWINELNVKNLSAVSQLVGTGYDLMAFNIEFDKPASIYDYTFATVSGALDTSKVEVNGKTIAQMITETGNNRVVDMHYMGIGTVENKGMHFYFDNIGPVAYRLKMDGTDKIRLLKGLITPDNKGILTKDWEYTYVPGRTAWFSTFNVKQLSAVTQISGLNTFSIEFDKSASAIDIVFANRIDTYYLDTMVLINGKTIASMQSETQNTDIVQVHWNGINGNSQNKGLNFYFPQTNPLPYNLKLDGTDTIKILKGFICPNNYILTQDVEFTYKPYCSTWATGVPNEIYTYTNITNVSAITSENGSKFFSITFDKAVTSKFLPHVNGEISWLRAVNPTIGNIYTEADFNNIVLNGSQETVLSKIKFDGKTLTQMMNNETNVLKKNATVMAHYNENTLSLYFDETADNNFNLNTNHTLEISSGLITPNNSKVNNPVVFKYYAATGNWNISLLTSNSFQVSDDGQNLLTNIQAGAIVSDFYSSANINIYSGASLVFKKGTTILNNSDTLGTGSTVTATYYGNTTQYSVVIYGDITGNGVIDISDLADLKKHILKINLLSGAYLKAGDYNQNSSISISDLLAVKKKILQIQ